MYEMVGKLKPDSVQDCAIICVYGQAEIGTIPKALGGLFAMVEPLLILSSVSIYLEKITILNFDEEYLKKCGN